MKGSRIDLKTFLGLAKPNQYSQSVRKQISSWFWGDNFGQNPQTFMIPIYSTTVLYDNFMKLTKPARPLQYFFTLVMVAHNIATSQYLHKIRSITRHITA